MPIEMEDFEFMADEDDVEVASSTKSLKHSLVIRDLSDTEEVSFKDNLHPVHCARQFNTWMT